MPTKAPTAARLGLLLLSAACPTTGESSPAAMGSTSTAATTDHDLDAASESGRSTEADPSADDTVTGGATEAGDTGSSGDSESDGATSTGAELETIDCAQAPTSAVSVEIIDGPRGYHGLVITPDGMMIGSDGASLLQATYDGDVSVFVPNLGYGEQMDWLPDGDIAHLTSDGALSRLGLDATVQTIAPVYAYALKVGPDGMAYVGGRNLGVVRIDPRSGEQELLFPPPPTLDNEVHALGFSPDGSRLYVGTIGGYGTVLYADFDETMTPITGLEIFAQGAGEFSDQFGIVIQWHEDVAVDACGNLFVPDFETSNIYRVTPGGVTTLFWEPDDELLHAHASVWGTGEHGWRADALYVPQPYNGHTVSELVVGIPGRDYAGPVINAEPMKP